MSCLISHCPFAGEEKQTYVDVADSSKTPNSTSSRKPPSSPQTATSAEGSPSIPTSPGAPTPAATEPQPKSTGKIVNFKSTYLSGSKSVQM